MKCPGQYFRKLTISYHACPTCMKPVEFFSDEMRVRCSHCKTMVVKDASPSCIQWCKAARNCLGPELYDSLIDKMKAPSREKNTKSD